MTRVEIQNSGRLAALLLAAVATAAGRVDAQALNGKPAASSLYEVELQTPLSLSQIGAAVPTEGLRIRQLIHVFAGRDGELTVGHLATTRGEALEVEYRQSVDATLDDLAMIQARSNGPADHSYDPTPVLVEAARAELEREGLRVSRMIVEGPPTAGLALESIGTVHRAPAPGAVPPPEAVQATCSIYFVAARTEAYTGPSLTGSRYVQQVFNWDSYNWGVLRACGANGNITYEQEFVTYNYDRLNYLGVSVLGWSSTMPNAYLDTTIDDGPDERRFTIGSSDANRIAAYTSYNNYIRVVNGNYYTDKAKITGQRGYRYPSFCYSTYCIWASATEFITRPASAPWLVTVPGYGGPFLH